MSDQDLQTKSQESAPEEHNPETVHAEVKYIDQKFNISQYMYYYLIGILSFVMVTFLPFIGSTADLQLSLPGTFAGWVVWIATKAITSIINVMIFHSFMCQAKINIKDHPKFIEANKILEEIKTLKIPRGPEVWLKLQYRGKATGIFTGTILSTIALTQAILTFDYVSMLTYIFTVVMGLVFGFFQMKTAEDYWTGEYWDFAQYTLKKIQESEENKAHVEDREQGTSQP